MIIINGNHDSKERLNYGSPWFQLSNLHIKTSLTNMQLSALLIAVFSIVLSG